MSMAEIMREDDEEVKDEEIKIIEDDVTPSNEAEEAEEDERSAKAETQKEDDEREAIRERRRLEKLERKDRRDKAISRDKIELDFLRKRNDELERRVTAQEHRTQQLDINGLDVQIQEAIRQAEMAERVIAKAVEVGNGADVTQAMRYRDQAIAKAQQLNGVKHQATQKSQQAPQIDDMTLHYANEFLADNKWYDPQGRDEDSAIVLAIDQALAKDGFNPQTEEYWIELERRAARRLPEKFTRTKPKVGDQREERQPRGGPTVGSGREHAPTSTRKEIYLSPDRKQALIDAGVWDDPILRVKYAKRYAEYDRANKV
tara:strand:+ start:106 stop:1053 length:948 start_codon:yes stop_codon:yes gene_type:complete